jgi:hypothetical protein
MLQGVQPSVQYVLQLLKVAQTAQLHFAQQAVRMDDSRRRFKKLLSAETYTEFEKKRLASLGRAESAEEDLAKLLQDIKQHTAEELSLVDVSTSAELWRLEHLYAGQLEQNLKIHQDYFSEVDNTTQLRDKEKDNLETSYQHQVAYLLSDGAAGSSAEQRTLLEQQHVKAALKVEQKYNEDLYASYKRVMGKVLSQVQVCRPPLGSPLQRCIIHSFIH